MDSSNKALPRRKAEDHSLVKKDRPARLSVIERILPGDLRGRFLVVLLGALLPSLTLFGILHHDSVKRSLLNEVDRTLVNRAREVAQVIESSGIQYPSDASGFEFASSSLLLTSAPEVYVELLDQQGKSLWRSRNLSGKDIPQGSTPLAVGDQFDIVEQPDGLRLRRFNKSLVLSDGSTVYIVLAESLTHLEAALKGSIGRTVLLGVIVLTLTELAANLAFRGLFAPLRKLVDTAEMIVSTDDVTKRVPVVEDSDEEIRRTAIAFNQLMDRVEQLLEMAKRLLADTSHELRNPLTVIMTDLDLLREELSPEQREEVVSEAQRTVRRLNRLVSDLLLLSRTEANSESAKLEEVDVVDFLEKYIARFARSLDDGQIISFHNSSGPDKVYAMLNREKTEQIFTNLFENGIRYSNGQELKVLVSQNSEKVRISVLDSGCGVAEDEQEKIFHRFYRVDRSRNRHSGGTGLGLPVARALAQLQGGDISVKSVLGQGSDFQVVFPRSLNPQEVGLQVAEGSLRA